jgi:hypothetical protein
MIFNKKAFSYTLGVTVTLGQKTGHRFNVHKTSQRVTPLKRQVLLCYSDKIMIVLISSNSNRVTRVTTITE